MIKNILFVLSILSGHLMASPSSLIDETKYQKCILKIRYEELLKNPPLERHSGINWKEKLQQLQSSNNLQWKIKHFSEFSTDEHQSVSVNLLLDNSIVILNIETLTGNWQERLDKTVYKLVLTNSVEVYGDVIESNADLHLRRNHTSTILVGPYHIDVSAWDEMKDEDFFHLEKQLISIVTNQ